MFLTHSDEAFEIEKFKRSRENKIEFAYDYGNLNASYVNEKINFENDYFQDIINPDFEKTDSPFQQTSSLKTYVPNVILEKIIIDLEDEVVNLLEKEKVNMETIESLKSKSFKSSEKVSSESENQSETDCLVVEKEYLDTFSSVRRPKNSGVIWKKKWSSNTSNVGLPAVSVSSLNKNVKRYSRKDLLTYGVDLLTGDRSSNLYTISLNEFASNSSTCLLAKASSSQSWLWHQRLSHLNFATINNLVKNNLVQ
nr:integrase, catalytic region, zinc finger, CCHC-type, peptidase aspartic, catalytic [Tanacetum cinerariifolium]